MARRCVGWVNDALLSSEISHDACVPISTIHISLSAMHESETIDADGSKEQSGVTWILDLGSWILEPDPTPPTTRARVLTSGPKRRAE